MQFAPVINVGNKTIQLGLFNFCAVLNVGIRLTENYKSVTFVYGNEQLSTRNI